MPKRRGAVRSSGNTADEQGKAEREFGEGWARLQDADRKESRCVLPEAERQAVEQLIDASFQSHEARQEAFDLLELGLGAYVEGCLHPRGARLPSEGRGQPAKAHVDRLILDLEKFWIDARPEEKGIGDSRGTKLPSIARTSNYLARDEPFYELVRWCSDFTGFPIRDPFRYLKRTLRPRDVCDDDR